MSKRWMVGLTAGVMSLGLFGCTQPQEAATAEVPPAATEPMVMPEHGAMDEHGEMAEHGEMGEATEAAALPEGANQTCPVMGGKAQAQYHTEYKGRTVYFCCPSCDENFHKDPDKYLAKLDAGAEAPAESAEPTG